MVHRVKIYRNHYLSFPYNHENSLFIWKVCHPTRYLSAAVIPDISISSTTSSCCLLSCLCTSTPAFELVLASSLYFSLYLMVFYTMGFICSLLMLLRCITSVRFDVGFGEVSNFIDLLLGMDLISYIMYLALNANFGLLSIIVLNFYAKGLC